MDGPTSEQTSDQDSAGQMPYSPLPQAAGASSPQRPESAAAVDAILLTPGDLRRGSVPPVRWREPLALAALVALCDVTVYRGQGLAGWALLLIAAPLLLRLGSPQPHRNRSLWIVGAMLAAFSLRLLWCGSAFWLPVGVWLLAAFAMSLSGRRPYVIETVLFASQTLWAGYQGLGEHGRFWGRLRLGSIRVHGLNILLPLVTAIVFSTLFVLANPDLLTAFGEQFGRLLDALRETLIHFAPQPLEVLFWLAVLWIGMGMLRPLSLGTPWDPPVEEDPRRWPRRTSKSLPAPLYPAFRNTLLAVILLFAVYLVFEFQTLWFRDFPDGFHYSGYAHQGAAWLTVALALATAVLSIVFRGDLLADPRLPSLKRLAWAWSLENLLLAAAVYHRLFIYVGFNGMTRMRIVGLFGISAVVVGFLLVLVKIARQHSFAWLIRRHLWTVAIAIYLLAITPSDAIVVRHNVRRILQGDPAPSVQISVHPIDAEGAAWLLELVDCPNETIREGVRALLAHRQQQAEQSAWRRSQLGWTSYQLAEQRLLERLRAARSKWSAYEDPARREAALRAFHEYAYQWY